MYRIVSKKKYLTIVITLLFFSVISTSVIANDCRIHLIIGSDTAIWDGMSTNRFNSTYNPDLYTDPSMNAYKVMDDNYRLKLIDSYGTPLKLTWWMMCGNIFRYATNTDCPIPNIMTTYHMKENHLTEIEKWGDELTLHYHTFKWSDYDNDGLWYWNQAKSFEECRKDFDFTLSQLLLEEENFFVSFRSGWHYMDNEWQAYLNELMPFSMHNALGSFRIDTEEPLDNNIDWRIAPDEWIPYQPSIGNYQLPGGNSGWNLRSAHIRNIKNYSTLDTVFARASRGIPQVVCLWGHLPEDDFCDNLEIIDSIAHVMELRYDEPFKYSTAIEGMQDWLKSDDKTAPNLTLTESGSSDELYFDISVSESIFQKYPYVAVKDIFENYYKMPCIQTGDLQWQTISALEKKYLAKIGVAICDSVGNQTLKFIDYLPNDQFIDNADENYHEIAGNWVTIENSSWGKDTRVSQLTSIDTAIVEYELNIGKSTFYNIFYQVPNISTAASNYIFQVISDNQKNKEVTIPTKLIANNWNYITTSELNQEQENILRIQIPAQNQNNKIAVSDVVKISPLVREFDLFTKYSNIYFGNISLNTTNAKSIELLNKGYKNLQISNMYSKEEKFDIITTTPLIIPAMGKIDILISLFSEEFGVITDSLVIISNDPEQSTFKIPVLANVQSYFLELDNEDSLNYFEFGKWKTSVAEAYGPSSRYSELNQTPKAFAKFTTKLDLQGLYEIEYIIPKTINTTNHALYTVLINNIVIDSLIIDQNEKSGGWVTLGTYFLPTNYDISLKIEDTGNNTNSNGIVLRADAVRFSMIEDLSDLDYEEILPVKFELFQNYPNPFNSSTTIQYSVPFETKVHIAVYNLIGQEVDLIINKKQSAGHYQLEWKNSSLSTGVYFYKLQCDDISIVKKMILMK